MGGQYPPLDRNDVEKILNRLDFKIVRQEGSHAQWEGYAKNQRRVVTVSHLKSRTEKYSKGRLNKIIKQSGLTKKEFYSYL